MLYQNLSLFFLSLNSGNVFTKFDDDLVDSYLVKRGNKWEEEKFRIKHGIPFDIELQNEFLKIDKNYNLNYFNNLI